MDRRKLYNSNYIFILTKYEFESLDTKQEISKFQEKENRWRRIFVPVYKNAKRSREDLVESRRICSDSFPSRVGNRVLSSEERGKFWNWGKKRRGRGWTKFQISKMNVFLRKKVATNLMKRESWSPWVGEFPARNLPRRHRKWDRATWILHETRFSKSLKVNPLAGTTSGP